MSSQTTTGPEGVCMELGTCFHVVYCDSRGAVVEPRSGWMECFDTLYERLSSLYGVQPKLVRLGEGFGVVFVRVRRGWGWGRFALFFLATLAAVLIAGFDVAYSFRSIVGFGSIPVLAVAFVAGLLGPLALHEGGHYTAAKCRGVPVSPPMFLPAPPPSLGGIGTFGAIMVMRGVPRDRDSLALVGISGPLVGFLASVIVALVGLVLSPVMPPQVLEKLGSAGGAAPFAPLALLLLGLVVGKGSGVVVLHPLALASYIIFLVTFLNLLPIGWLDGGHVVYAVFGEKVHRVTSMLVPWVSMLVALVYPQLLFLALFSLLAYGLYIIVSRGVHPGVANPLKPLGAGRAALYAGLYAALLVLTIPVPA